MDKKSKARFDDMIAEHKQERLMESNRTLIIYAMLAMPNIARGVTEDEAVEGIIGKEVHSKAGKNVRSMLRLKLTSLVESKHLRKEGDKYYVPEDTAPLWSSVSATIIGE